MTTRKVPSNIEAFVKRVKKKMDMTPKKVVLKKVVSTEALSIAKEPKKSKGQEFKEKYGFSKTFKRNAIKKGFDPYNEEGRIAYRKHRNLNK